MLDNAKALRGNQTDAEQRLWYHLRAHRFMGLKFKRQKPIGRYIVDFVCMEHRLIIELDGGQHAEQAAYDRQRDAWLHGGGYRVLRFWNNDVMQELEGVLERIRGALFLVPSPQPSPRTRGEGAGSPLPLAGEGSGERVGEGEQSSPLSPPAGRGPGRGV